MRWISPDKRDALRPRGVSAFVRADVFDMLAEWWIR